jgi:hypothetical protein
MGKAALAERSPPNHRGREAMRSAPTIAASRRTSVRYPHWLSWLWQLTARSVGAVGVCAPGQSMARVVLSGSEMSGIAPKLQARGVPSATGPNSADSWLRRSQRAWRLVSFDGPADLPNADAAITKRRAIRQVPSIAPLEATCTGRTPSHRDGRSSISARRQPT